MDIAKTIDQELTSIHDALMKTRSQRSFDGILKKKMKQMGITYVSETHDFDKFSWYVSGMYDMSKDEIHIVFTIPENVKRRIIFEEDWKDFKFVLSQTIQHEEIHRYQFLWRQDTDEEVEIDYKSTFFTDINEEREYLSDRDEIDAYAHDIALEILYNYPKQNPYAILKNVHRRRKVWSYSYYKKTFAGQSWKRVRQLLLKKTYLWLSTAKVYY